MLKAHPKFGILSEEVGEINKENKENRWIIDPIDGTMNFLNGIPHFAISIGYEEKGEIVSGIIFDPIKDETFFAEKGAGAFLNNSRIRVSNRNKLKESMLVTGGPKPDSKKRDLIFQEYINISNLVDNSIRKFGSASLDIANVACGRFDAYWQWEIKYWDIAAGLIILKEAGGYVDFLGENKEVSNNRNIIASNSKIHQDLAKVLTKIYWEKLIYNISKSLWKRKFTQVIIKLKL